MLLLLSSLLLVLAVVVGGGAATFVRVVVVVIVVPAVCVASVFWFWLVLPPLLSFLPASVDDTVSHALMVISLPIADNTCRNWKEFNPLMTRVLIEIISCPLLKRVLRNIELSEILAIKILPSGLGSNCIPTLLAEDDFVAWTVNVLVLLLLSFRVLFVSVFFLDPFLLLYRMTFHVLHSHYNHQTTVHHIFHIPNVVACCCSRCRCRSFFHLINIIMIGHHLISNASDLLDLTLDSYAHKQSSLV